MVAEKHANRVAPQITDLPAQRMAVVYTQGDPNMAGGPAMSALYGAVYSLKFALKKQGREFPVGPLRARWPNAHTTPKEQWQAIWGLPIPEDTTSLVQKVPGITVQIETWEYGLVGQILHTGPFSTEGPTVARLHEFIAACGYAIAGLHEEQYLTPMTAKTQRTIIRYPIRRVSAQAPALGVGG